MKQHFIKQDTQMINKHMKIYSTSLLVTEIQIKTIIKILAKSYLMNTHTYAYTHAHNHKWPRLKRLKYQMLARMCNNWDPSTLLLRVEKWYNPFENYWQLYLKTELWPSISPIGVNPIEVGVYVHQRTGTRLFIATLFIITPNWKWSTLTVSGRKNKLQYIYAMDYYRVMKNHCKIEQNERNVAWMKSDKSSTSHVWFDLYKMKKNNAQTNLWWQRSE